MTAAKKIDIDDSDDTNWYEVATEFAHGCLSGPKFAAKFGLNYDTLHKRCTKERWLERREAFWKRKAAEQDDVEIERLKTAQADIDDEAIALAKKAMAKAAELIDKAPTLSQLKAGVDALDKAYRLRREAEGLPPKKDLKEVVSKREEPRGPLYIARRDEHGDLHIRDMWSDVCFYPRQAEDQGRISEKLAEGADLYPVVKAKKPAALNSDDEPVMPDPQEVEGWAVSGKCGDGSGKTTGEANAPSRPTLT